MRSSIQKTRIAPPSGWLAFDLSELWGYRELTYFLVWRDLKVRYKQTLIGVVWALVQPLLGMVVLSLLFGRLGGLPTDGMPYPLFYYPGLVIWTYFASAVTSAANSTVQHQGVITKVYFPRLLLPLAGAMSPAVDLFLALSLLAIITPIFGGVLHLGTLLFPLFVVMAIATAFGLGLWLSSLNAVFRDVRHAVPFLIQLWFLASPIAYSSSIVPAHWKWAYSLNPMAEIVRGFRWSVTGRGPGPDAAIWIAVGVIVLLLGTGLVVFKRIENNLADIV